MYNIVIAQTRFSFIGKREKKILKSVYFFFFILKYYMVG